MPQCISETLRVPEMSGLRMIINDFSALRAIEIVTNMRNPGYRPAYLCLFTHLIASLPGLQAVRFAFYGCVYYTMILFFRTKNIPFLKKN